MCTHWFTNKDRDVLKFGVALLIIFPFYQDKWFLNPESHYSLPYLYVRKAMNTSIHSLIQLEQPYTMIVPVPFLGPHHIQI